MKAKKIAKSTAKTTSKTSAKKAPAAAANFFADVSKLNSESSELLKELLSQNIKDKAVKKLSMAVKAKKLEKGDFEFLDLFIQEVSASIEEDLAMMQVAKKNVKALKQDLKATRV